MNLKKNISLEQSQTLVSRIDELRTRDDRIQMRREDSLQKNEITKLPSIDQDSKSGLKCKNYIYIKNKIALRSLKSTNSNGYQRHFKSNNKEVKHNLQNMIKSNIERNKLFEQCMNFNILGSGILALILF